MNAQIKHFTTQKQRKSLSGFTLIELLVVTTLVVLLMMSVSAMFMTFLVGNAQTNIRRQIKGEGNEIISQIEFLFRGASSVQKSGVNLTTAVPAATCTPSGSSFLLGDHPVTITDADNNTYTLTYIPAEESMKIKNGTATAVSINTSKVIPQSPTITCYGSPTSDKKSIKIDFQLQWKDNTNFMENYSTTVQLRNS